MKKLTKYILIGAVSLLAVGGATFGVIQALDTTNEPTGGDTPPVTVESYLSTPKNIELSLNYTNNKTEYILSWDYVTHAEKFCITIGEKEFYTTTIMQQSYDISSAVTVGETYDIKVKAIGDGEKYGNSENGVITETIKKVTSNLVYEEVEDGTYSVAKSSGDIVIDGSLVLPDTYEGEIITVIPQGGFEENYHDDTMSIFAQKGITSVRFPKYLKKIGYGAFWCCLKLQRVILPETVTEFENSIFDYCKSLTSITFPADMTIIPNSICRDCSSLKIVTLPSSLVEIGRQAFSGTGLESVEIPETVTVIGGGAFSHTKIKSVELPSGLKRLSGFSFTDIEEVTIPANVEYMESTFEGCEKLKKVEFEENSRLTTITSAAFNRTLLEKIDLPESLTVIGGSAFRETLLSTIDLPAGITTIGSAVFQDTLLTEIILPEGLTAIGDYAFANTFLEEIEIPASVTSIGVGICAPYSVFTNKRNESTLKEIKVAQGNTTYKAMDGDLYTIDGKKLVQYAIAKTATEFVTPDGLEIIGERALCGAVFLKEIRLRNSVQLVSDGAFESCTALEEVQIPDNGILINRAFANCTSLGLLKIPPSAQVIIYTTPAKFVEFLDGRLEIANGYIGNNNLKPNIIIPKSVTRIVGISLGPFGAALNLPVTIYYKGTAEDWAKIECVKLGTTDLTFYYYSETEPPMNADGTGYDGNYWYYGDDGVPVVWEYQESE